MKDQQVVDDEDKDETFQPDEEPEAEDLQDEGESTPLTVEEFIKSGIPMARQKRAKDKNPAIFKYECDICCEHFQKTNDLKDHKYVQHLGRF